MTEQLTPEESRASFRKSVEENRPQLHKMLDLAMELALVLQALGSEEGNADETVFIAVETAPLLVVMEKAGYPPNRQQKAEAFNLIQSLLFKYEGEVGACFVWGLAHNLDHIFHDGQDSFAQH